MFNKPTFGPTTSGFGGFNSSATTASPFSGFKPNTGTSAFGAPPAFGTAATQQNTGGLFGASNTSTGLFGGTTSTAAPAFGNTSTGFGSFGASTSTGLFGANNTTTGLFGGTQPNTSFGAKPAGFGFGGTSTANTTTGGLFGSTPNTGTSLFGQQTNTGLGGGLFSNNTSTFGGTATGAAGTAHVKYSPLVGTDVVVKSGNSQSINIKHHCITCMKEYEGKSLEELRLEDYQAGRKGSSSGMFGFQQTEAKPLFGGTTAFGQPATTTAPSVFGANTLGNTAFPQNNTFSFGSNAQSSTNTTGGLFGAAKPTFGATTAPTTGLFGATTTQAPTFGATSAPSFGFGSNTQTQQTGGLFGPKPAAGAFGTSTGNAGFGSFGGGTLFGKPAQTQAPAFGTTTPAFGTALGSSAFGTATSTATGGGGLFGNTSTFGKPNTAQTSFGFNAPTTGLGTGLGAGLGASTFQPKPAATNFGSLGGGLFNTNNNNSFGANNTLGGGMFNTSGLGGSALGGLGTLGNNNTMPQNNSLSGSSAAGNVHEQILTLVARPYGDSALFKDLPMDTMSSSEALKPTNPAALKAVLDSTNNYRVTNSNTRLKLHATLTHDKKSLFDGLEESDATLEDKLSLRPSRKRLVLRPRGADSVDGDSNRNRSLEDQPQSTSANGPGRDVETNNNEEERIGKDTSNQDSNHLDASDRHGSWLNASKHQWSAEKEKPVDSEPTPRLYPNLDKEINTQTPERRASWLTTKPLRKPLSSNPEAAENSVRELAVRPPVDTSDKENDTPSVIEEEAVAPRDMPPHPTGVKLTRPGYYTIPSLDEMIKYMRPDGSCVVPHLAIGRKNYGNVFYDCEIDVAGLDLDALVHFLNKEVTIYPDDADKPPVGQGLNRRAIVTLDRVWPRDKTEKRPITDPDRLLAMDYEGKLRRVCDKHDTKFVEYRPQTGSWVFRVEHFSKYSLEDSDEEDDPTPEVMKRQLVSNQLQKAAPIAPQKPVQPGLGGLGGLGGPGFFPSQQPFGTAGLTSSLTPGLTPPLYGLGQPLVAHDDLYAMQQTSLNLLTGAGKAFEMDTTEDNTSEAPSLYQDSQRAFGVKSPTSELARLEHRHSHNVQLMKASLYADTEMEDDVSISTGDQQVPREIIQVALPRPPSPKRSQQMSLIDEHVVVSDEIVMKPLIVRPHTIVLKYHRKVPPFKKTIAGRLNASHIADMSICRARHSRVGFGPRCSIVYNTSYDSLADLPTSSELSELGRYVSGRADDDWSEPVVARVALQMPQNNGFMDTMNRHLDTLLKYSTFTTVADNCPKLSIMSEPEQRRKALLELIDNCSGEGGMQFGVTSAYCKEVFSLCEALWGADLENDGVCGTDEASILNRYRKLLVWLTAAVADVTDRELKRPTSPEKEDETDAHSIRVWTLLLGGRVLQACKVAIENGDSNMATLIAQCSGDPSFRSLVSRQISQWRECGADTLISTHRLCALRLVCGLTSPREQLETVDWLRAFHAVYRYICPQVPSLEHAIRTYEGLFPTSGEDEPQLWAADGMGMQPPLPPYETAYDCENGRRVPDLRYELIKARAMNTRPKLQPAAYTPDPMDYSLCFILGVWFGNTRADSIVGVAEQLEAAGAWHRAVQVLQYHTDDVARAHLVRAVLSRHAPAKADSDEAKSRLELVRRLQVPDQWLLLAQAYRAKYEHLPAIEAEHLVGAEQWNAAHKVLLDELLPDAVLADDLQSIAPLVEKLHSASQRHEVSGWESGGLALHHYMHVCTEIRGLVSSAESETQRSTVSTRLEALRPRVAAACRALGRLSCPTPRHSAARSEMGARLVQLSLCAGEPAPHVAALLRALRLPPDCTATAHYKITTDLAEAASEMCIESASSSPISSHHRAAVQS